MKKIVSLLIAVILITGLVSVPAFAAGNEGVTVTRPVKFQKVSIGNFTSLALDEEGNLWRWGIIDVELVDGIFFNSIRSDKPEKMMENVKDIGAGYMHAVVLKNDGTVWTWGSNFDGRLGDGTETERYTPKKIMDNVTAISTGFYHTLAIKKDGSLWAWGSNENGQIGDGTRTAALSPKKIADNVIGISAGEDTSLFIKSDHSLWGMGSQVDAELGSLDFDDLLTPVWVMGDVSAVCCHSGLILKTDGSAWEYGTILENESKGMQKYRRVPTPQKVMDNVSYIATDDLLRFAIKKDGSLWSWGTNRDGQLGDGTTDWRLVPRKIMDSVVQVSTDGYSCLAVKKDGTLWAWGKNDQGQLGDGTETDHYSPVQIMVTETVVLPTQFYDVEAGAYYVDPVKWAVENEITNGVDDTHFDPNVTCSRAQAVTFLWRAAGCPEPKSGTSAFSDVPTKSYYAKAVKWAVENNVTTGTGPDTFSPDDPCSRAQIVTFLYRAAGSHAVSSETAKFKDVPAGKYYENAVKWAVENKITKGTDTDMFSPDDPCTRGQIVTFLYRYTGK